MTKIGQVEPRSLTLSGGGLQRKRSQSLADIQVPLGFRNKEAHTMGSQHKKFSKTKSEESGYDSDTTRKSGSSPRGSVKSDSFDPSETESSTSERTSVEGERRTEEEEEMEERNKRRDVEE